MNAPQTCTLPEIQTNPVSDKVPTRAGRSLSREPAERSSSRDRSLSPSWTHVGWAVGRRGRSKERTVPNSVSLNNTAHNSSAGKSGSPMLATQSHRRHSVDGLQKLPAVSVPEPSHPTDGFSSLLQALRVWDRLRSWRMSAGIIGGESPWKTVLLRIEEQAACHGQQPNGFWMAAAH